MEQGEGRLFQTDNTSLQKAGLAVSTVLGSYTLNLTDWLPAASNVCSPEPILAFR